MHGRREVLVLKFPVAAEGGGGGFGRSSATP